MYRTLLQLVTTCLLALLMLRPADAALTIEITGGTEGAQPIAVVPFGWKGTAAQPPQDVGTIVAADLRRSGRFAPVAPADMLARPHSAQEVDYHDWRVLGVNDLVVGNVTQTGPDAYTVQFQLLDVFQGRQLAGYSVPTSGAELRHAAHYISDLIYQALTGDKGAFNTRIAYVTASGPANARTYKLQVADSDGYDPQTILRSNQPIMSPAWSPDGRRLAYVSFEHKRAEIYIQDLGTGTRRMVSAQPGINGAPAFSPDGKRLALTLSKDGNAEVYIMDLATGALHRLTHNPAIDTEATWAPDGQSLVFTSDRGGSPQLYRIPVDGGTARRITFEGNYNAGADFAPDGSQVAFVHRENGKYRIAVLDLASGALRVVSKGSLDESPSFAPNGAMIIYATEGAGRGELAVVSVDGRASQRLLSQEGDVREPAWSPLIH